MANLKYIKHVKPLENEDQSNDEEIVATLKTYTSKPIPILLLKRYLRENGLMNAARNSGKLITFADALPEGHDLRHAVDLLTDIMLDNRDSIDTTQGEDAKTFHNGLIGLQANCDDVDETVVADVFALAGGFKYPELEVSELVEARAKYELEQKFSDLLNTISGAMETEFFNDESTVETIRQAAIDAANGWSE